MLSDVIVRGRPQDAFPDVAAEAVEVAQRLGRGVYMECGGVVVVVSLGSTVAALRSAYEAARQAGETTPSA